MAVLCSNDQINLHLKVPASNLQKSQSPKVPISKSPSSLQFSSSLTSSSPITIVSSSAKQTKETCKTLCPNMKFIPQTKNNNNKIIWNVQAYMKPSESQTTMTKSFKKRTQRRTEK